MGAFDTKTVAPFSNPAQIGDTQFHPESGTLINKPNGEGLLKSGILALTSLYPQAAGAEHIMAHGAGTSTPATLMNVSGMAHNGAGTLVVAFGSTTNVAVSTNYGQTWAYVAHNLAGGAQATDVIWNGAQFIVVGNTAALIVASFSIAAAVFTAGTTSASVTSATANTCRIAWDGSLALAVCGGAAVQQAATTPTGVTLTAVSLSQVISAPRVTVLVSLGASRWYVSNSVTDTTACQSTLANATTWANRVTPQSSTSFGFITMAAGLTYLVGVNISSSTNYFYKSTTGADGSWVQTTWLGNSSASHGNILVADKVGINFDGTRFLISSGQSSISSGYGTQFAYTTDFSTLTFRQIALPTIGSSGSYQTIPFSLGTNICFLYSGGTTAGSISYANSWFTSSEYVGSSSPIVQIPTSITTRAIVGYIKVKG